MMIYTLEGFKFTLCKSKSVCIQMTDQDIFNKYKNNIMIYTLESLNLLYGIINQSAF